MFPYLRSFLAWLMAIAAAGFVGTLAFDQLTLSSGKVPGLSLLLLLLVTALIWRLRVGGTISRRVAAVSLAGIWLLAGYSFSVYALATEICRGTGTGGNQSLRLCQDGSYFPVAATMIVSMLLTMAVFRYFDVPERSHLVGILAMIFVWLVIGTFVWFHLFFQMRVR